MMYVERFPKMPVKGERNFRDQPCAVIEGESAVYDINTGVYRPSWTAQNRGWRLIQIRSPLQRLLYRWFFDE